MKKKSRTFGITISWFIINVFYYFISINSGDAFAYGFYLVGIGTLIMIIADISNVVKSTISSIKLKTQFLVLIAMAFISIDLIITNGLVMNMASNQIKKLSNLEGSLIGKEINYTIKTTYSEGRDEFSKFYNLPRWGPLGHHVFRYASSGINVYILNENNIERALLFNDDANYNIIMINPETIKRRVADKRYRRVRGGTEPYFASLPEETVLWKFISVVDSLAYKFALISVGTMDGADFGGKREEFYSDLIQTFEQIRRVVVKEKILEKYYPTFLLSLFH